MTVGSAVPAGHRLFARYAYAPNHLGYCGPADTAALAELAATGQTGADIPAIASRFSGAWPYLTVLAELAGIGDPLDERVVRAYWTGGPLLEQVDPLAFGTKLIGRIGAGAGHYWRHLDESLLCEASPTHAFHVFGVYPWTRLLTAGPPEPALRVLDSCRVRWGEVVSVAGGQVTVRGSRLTWDGRRLGLAPDTTESVVPGFVTDPRPGEWLAVHWDWASDRLTEDQLACLRYWTQWQIAATNERLARA